MVFVSQIIKESNSQKGSEGAQVSNLLIFPYLHCGKVGHISKHCPKRKLEEKPDEKDKGNYAAEINLTLMDVAY
jgi:hypothetical protein